jgi:HK97 family phage major capsid protein
MSDDIKRLTETRVKAWKAMSEVLATASAEDRAMTGEEVATFSSAQADLNAAAKDIEARVEFEKIEKALNEPAPTPGVPSGEPRDAPAAAEQRDKAFDQYLRYKLSLDDLKRDAYAEHRAFIGEASIGVGGALVPPGFLAKLTQTLKWFGGVRAVANVITTDSGYSLVWPVNDDTGNPAVIIGENTQVADLALTFTQKTSTAVMWTTGAIRVGRAVLQDSAFDLDSVIADRAGKRIGRGQNTAFTTGTGITSGLAGVTTGATNASSSLLALAQGGATQVSVVGNLLPLINSVDPAYRQSGRCVFMMNSTSLQQAQGLLDGNGRPVFVPAGSYGSIANTAAAKNLDYGAGVDTLLGFPIIINNDLPSSATTGAAKTVIFGDFQSGYIIRDVANSFSLMRLEERYADFGQVGYIGYVRGDGVLDDAAALRALADHA